MIDLTQLQPDDFHSDLGANSTCSCCGEKWGDWDHDCDNTAQAIAEALVLESPILKLIKERNEARELVKRMLRATDGVTDSKEYYAAMLEAHRAEMRWKGGAQ